MSRPRMFDHDEARRLRDEGWTYTALAERFGVAPQSIANAVDPHVRAYRRAYQQRGSCPDCGVQTSNHGSRSSRCIDCAADARTTSAREDALRCSRCRRWLPDGEFHHWSHAPRSRRGRRYPCIDCDTAQRQNYRLGRWQPCVDCGTPALPPSEKGARAAPFPRCAPCAHASRRKQAAA